MARKTFRQYAAELSPTVLQGQTGERFVAGTLGLFLDLHAAWLFEGVGARLFTSPQQPVDALAYLGEERLSPRYAIDTDATHRARLQDAWNRWSQAGSEAGLLAELEAAFELTVELKFNNEWDWDGDTANWSRFWLVVHDHPWLPPPALGDPGLVLDGTWTLGSSATPEEVDTVRKIVRRWKPAHMVCANIILVFDESEWASNQPDGTWADPTARCEDACYWPG